MASGLAFSFVTQWLRFFRNAMASAFATQWLRVSQRNGFGFRNAMASGLAFSGCWEFVPDFILTDLGEDLREGGLYAVDEHPRLLTLRLRPHNHKSAHGRCLEADGRARSLRRM
jgi:hypothetical protein